MSDDTQNIVSPALEVAREIENEDDEDDIRYTEDGVRIRLRPVPAAIIDEVTNKIPQPEIPIWHNEEYNRDEPQPQDPRYLQAVEEADRLKAGALIDACAMFGIILVDGMPEDDEWLKKLRFLEKRNQLDLSAYDMEDELELEFVYKRYYVATIAMINEINGKSAVTQEDISKQRRKFRRKTKR